MPRWNWKGRTYNPTTKKRENTRWAQEKIDQMMRQLNPQRQEPARKGNLRYAYSKESRI